MDASGKPARASRVRLLLLAAIAFIGYEYVLYWHWMTAVPLLPTTTLELLPDRVPIGFVGSGEFIFARRTLNVNDDIVHGPVEFRSLPAGEKLAERLTPVDRIATKLPLSEKLPTLPYEDRPRFHAFSYGRPVVAHEMSDSPRRALTFYGIDRDQFLCVTEDTLQSFDPNTDRVSWSLSRVYGVASIDGDYAFVMRKVDGPLQQQGRPQVSPVLVSLRDGSCIDRTFPAEAFDLSDISPDGRLIVCLLQDAFEVWSIGTRSRLWRKPTEELGTRQLRFSGDSETLVSSTLDEAGHFQSSSFRVIDGERLTTGREPADPSGSIFPAIAIAGSRYAFFHSLSSKRDESDLARWLQLKAARAGLFMTPPFQRRLVTLMDIEQAKPLGVVDLTEGVGLYEGLGLLTNANGSGFALHRSRMWKKPATLEFYTLPPRRNWTWWSIRAIGLPMGLLAVGLGSTFWRRSRRVVAAGQTGPT